MERTALKSDLLVLTIVTSVGILLSALFLWAHLGAGDTGRDTAELPMVGAAPEEPLRQADLRLVAAAVVAGHAATTGQVDARPAGDARTQEVR